MNNDAFSSLEHIHDCFSVVIVGDISRIFGEDIAHDLVDRVVSLYHKGIIYGIEDLLHLGL